MRSLLVAALVLVLVAGSTQAGVIMITTQDTWEGGTGRAGELPDDQFITWLQGMGHTVIKKTVTGVIGAAAFATELETNNVDLVIIGPRNSSGNYSDKGLNAIPVPMLAMLPHAIRPDRLNWPGAGAAGTDGQAWTDVDVTNVEVAGHAWVAGLGTKFFDYTSTNGNGDTRWYDAGNTAGSGDVIARRSGDVDTLAIVSWDVGDILADNTTLTAPRAVFMGTNWARCGADWTSSFDTNYTADGKESLRRVISSIIPEPTTLALLGLGVVASLIRRKK